MTCKSPLMTVDKRVESRLFYGRADSLDEGDMEVMKMAISLFNRIACKIYDDVAILKRM